MYKRQVEGSVKWEFDGANAIKVTDKTGDSMLVQLPNYTFGSDYDAATFGLGLNYAW